MGNLNSALKSLKAQHIPTSGAVVGEHGFVFDVMGFMLTEKQIVALAQYGRLNTEGIRAFADSVKDDPNARAAMPEPWNEK